METSDKASLISAGEQLSRTIRYSAEEIAQFARMTFDHNPLHVDAKAARRSQFGRLIAAGQHTSAIMMGLVATHFSRSDDGMAREMVCLNFNFAYKLPVFADQDIVIRWKVASVEWSRKLEGQLAHLDGTAGPEGSLPSVIARGTILVKPAEDPASRPAEAFDIAEPAAQ